ncbi:MAG: bifunctional class I SAM-dependent methyltransferase/glycosyltransferase family 2 protein [bacterium]|nr:bifunctional class I SAM-dependent methyltransferase/glycosyltransferase family 2 protein [bacterium]
MNKNLLKEYFDCLALNRDKWIRRNNYYHKSLKDLCRFVVPAKSSVLEVGCGTGDLLNSIEPSYGLGIDFSGRMIEIASKKYPNLNWRVADAEKLELGESFDYIIFSDLLGYLNDIERAFWSLRSVSNNKTRVVITYYNYFWEPVLRLAEFLHLKAKQPIQNWLSPNDVENMLGLAGFEIIKQGNKVLLPVYIPLVSIFVNKILANLPLLSRLGLIQYVVARPIPEDRKNYSVSIIIPARNEKGNIENAIKRMPSFGTTQEIIFIEGHSTDDTFDEIKRVADHYTGKYNIKWARQKGKGKGDAVRLGFEMATGDILMILDADLTMPPEDLPKFYNAIASGRGEFINGSRLVYPLENESMRFLNILGNKFFSLMFSWILGQRIKDTLCGTKVLFKKDYELIAANRKYFGDFDPFGDFDLLFGAAKLNLKIVEMPIRYQARTYGDTNIQRWRHGWLLLKMTLFAARKFKFR